jgi:DNA-binding IclR family transcriptional regulator
MFMPQGPATIRRKSSLPGRPGTRDPADAGNRTIVIGVRLLQAVSRMNGPATLTEIAQRTGMSISRAYRYLTSLTQTGLLTHELETGKYDLGPAAIELGIAAMARVDMIRVASDVMRQLTEQVHLVSILVVWGSNGPTVIKWEQGRLDLSVRIREGLNLPMPITASGRLFMTYLDAKEVQPLLERDIKAWNASAPAKKKLDKKAIEAIRKDVLKHGLAYTSGMRTPQTAAIAGPIFDPDGRLSMTISLVGVVGTFDTSFDGEPARALKAATERLSHMVGARLSPDLALAGSSGA